MRIRLSFIVMLLALLVVAPTVWAQNTALNRTTAALLTNKSGGSLVYGDVVILDNTNAKGFTTTTTAALSSRGIGVILEPNGIANNATGMVAVGGWVPKVNLNTAATVGQFLKTHTVAGQATPHSSPQVEGDFGVALQASATPEAILFGKANGPGGSGSGDVVGPGSATDNGIVRFDGTTGKLVQDSALTIGDTGVVAFPDGIRQTFNPDGTNAGLNAGSQAGDPSSLSNGDLWYNSSSNALKARINGATVSLGSGGVTCETHTASSSATLEFTTWYSASYDEYAIHIVGVIPATDAVNLFMDFSTDGGSTWINSGYRYSIQFGNQLGSFSTTSNNTSTTGYNLGGTLENTTSTGFIDSTIRLFNPGSTTRQKGLLIDSVFQSNDSNYYFWKGMGALASTSDIDGIRFKMDSGNIAEGSISVCPVPK